MNNPNGRSIRRPQPKQKTNGFDALFSAASADLVAWSRVKLKRRGAGSAVATREECVRLLTEISTVRAPAAHWAGCCSAHECCA